MAVCGKFSRNLIDRRQRTGFWENKVETLVKYNGINAFSNNEHDLNDDKKDYRIPSLVSFVNDVTVCDPGDNHRHEERKYKFDGHVDIQSFPINMRQSAVA